MNLTKLAFLKSAIFFILFFYVFSSKAQINYQDSSVIACTYWNLGDEYEYDVSFQKLSYFQSDTTLNETQTYTVNISVIDSTENSYTMRWKYKNITSNSSNSITQKISKIFEGVAIDIKIDECGIVQSVENWLEIKHKMEQSIDDITSDLILFPEMEQILRQFKDMYSSKSAIESVVIQDIRQFHQFYGAEYSLNDTFRTEVLSPNIYDDKKPFTTNLTIALEDLDEYVESYTLRLIQEMNSDQLSKTALNIINDNQNALGRENIDSDVSNLKNSIETVSKIHVSGWIFESTLTKKITANGVTTLGIRIIDLK